MRLRPRVDIEAVPRSKGRRLAFPARFSACRTRNGKTEPRRDARLQSRTFARWNQSLRHNLNSNRLY
jgi:hypothetical protein